MKKVNNVMTTEEITINYRPHHPDEKFRIQSWGTKGGDIRIYPIAIIVTSVG